MIVGKVHSSEKDKISYLESDLRKQLILAPWKTSKTVPFSGFSRSAREVSLRETRGYGAPRGACYIWVMTVAEVNAYRLRRVKDLGTMDKNGFLEVRKRDGWKLGLNRH